MIWRCYYDRKGEHIHLRLFVGRIEGALGKCGDLVMGIDEFEEFTRLRQVIPMEFVAEEHYDRVLPVYFASGRRFPRP